MAKSKKKIRRLTISLPQENFERINEIATGEDRSVSWIICKAVEKFLSNDEKKEEKKSDEK